MLSKRDVSDAVAAALHKKWPDRDVHQNRCPADFIRPCFLIETPRASRRDASANLIEETLYLTLVCYGRLDEFGNSDTDELADIQQGVIDLFRAGYLRVSNRAVKFAASEGGMDLDRCWIDLQCSYFERRTAEPIRPKMMEIHNKTTI